MLRSFRVATVAGIGIYLHWTFLAIAGLALGVSLSRLETDPFALRAVAFYAAVFFCVVVHELGHALAAQRFGITTSRITLLPIGGLAQLESPPKTALSELVIALAGPAVNVVIAAVISASIWLTSGAVELIRPSTLVTGFLRDLAIANAALVLFNMIPALPMDGGRVFRAVLSMISNQRRATMIASSLGKLIAVSFAISGLFILPNPVLVAVGVFVFIAASAENRFSEVQARTQSHRVEEAMSERVITIGLETEICEASRLMLSTGQQDLPVITEGTYLGIVRRQDVISALKTSAECSPVREIITRTPSVQLNGDLWEAAIALQHPAVSTIAVVDGEDFVGVVTRSNIQLVVETGMLLQPRASAGVLRSRSATDQPLTTSV